MSLGFSIKGHSSYYTGLIYPRTQRIQTLSVVVQILSFFLFLFYLSWPATGETEVIFKKTNKNILLYMLI